MYQKLLLSVLTLIGTYIGSLTMGVISAFAQMLVEPTLQSIQQSQSISPKVVRLRGKFEEYGLFSTAIEVNETEASFHQRMNQQRQQPIFERTLRGNYWIFSDNKREALYLLPKQNLKFNKHNLERIQICFQVDTSQRNGGSKCRVLCPVIVVPLFVGNRGN